MEYQNKMVQQGTGLTARAAGSGISLMDYRATATVQLKQSDALGEKNQQVIQRKGRIDPTKIKAPEGFDLDVEEIKTKIAALKLKRKTDKKAITSAWTQSPGSNEARDAKYNEDIIRIRKEYEEGIKAINEELKAKGILDAYVDGDAYYGTPKADDAKVFKRPDNNKEYVKDMRGTFIPRYVRRELNQKDDISADLKPTGIKKYGELMDNGKVHDIEGSEHDHDISWAHREFIQQSRGGGGNQFAFSHTATKRPILSNDHLSFGTHPNGAILTDLAKIDTAKIAAQWELDPVTGHKVLIGDDKHAQLGSEAGFKERDQKVRLSGYRNKEVITESIPQDSIVKQPGDPGWGDKEWTGNYHRVKDADVDAALGNVVLVKGERKKKKKSMEKDAETANNAAALADYADGTSKRGNAMIAARADLEK